MTKRILVCYDEAGSGNAVLEAGRRLAGLMKAELTIIKVQPEASGLTGYYEHLFHEEIDRIGAIFGGANKDDILFAKKVFEKDKKLPNFKIAAGDPAKVIIQELEGGSFQLAILGIKRDRAPGQIAEAVIKKSPVDVLLVKI